jgi:hypothetical protein
MPTSKKSPSSRASRNIYVEVEETINTKMFESLCFRGGSFYLFSCKNKKGGEKAQATKTDGVVFSAHFFWWGGRASGKESHFYLNMSSMKQIKCTIYVNYPRIWTWTLH